MQIIRFALTEPESPPQERAASEPTAKRLVAAALGAVVAGSGALNFLSLLGGPIPSRDLRWLWRWFPLNFLGVSRSLRLILAFTLILGAIHLWSRKRRALQLVLALSIASIVIRLAHRPDFIRVLPTVAVAALLLWTRDLFSVGSARPTLISAVRRGIIAMSIPFLYGVAGFWLLEPHEFGQNFHWLDSVIRTLQFLTFFGDQNLLPKTAYAAWFLDSITLIAFLSLAYVGLILFRPVAYRFRFDPFAQQRAAAIASRYGRSGQDFFKHYPDKSYFFSKSGASFVAYRVAGKFAIALGDPVGPEGELPEIIEGFNAYCRERGWRAAFHQVFPDRLPVYLSLGLRHLKIGDDALVDLSSFSLSGSSMKEFRNTVNRLSRQGYRVERLQPPIEDAALEELRQVSDEWLMLPGHRERRFTLGMFDPDYVRSTTVYAVFDGNGRIAAFLNLIQSYRRGLATVDLMRRRPDAPNGVMDFLFAEVFLDLKASGYEQFSLGMAPLAAFGAGERQTKEERVLCWVMKNSPFLFRADTLRRFKAKYADHWEPRYSVYSKSVDLPQFALALRRVSELERA